LSCRSWPCARTVHGFTLIEVIGALVIFSVGVLMFVQVSGALGVRMRRAGTTSELSVFASERLDSLEAEPFTALVPGIASDSIEVEGLEYARTVTITVVTPLLKRIDVSLVPAEGSGPSHAVTTYTADRW